MIQVGYRFQTELSCALSQHTSFSAGNTAEGDLFIFLLRTDDIVHHNGISFVPLSSTLFSQHLSDPLHYRCPIPFCAFTIPPFLLPSFRVPLSTALEFLSSLESPIIHVPV